MRTQNIVRVLIALTLVIGGVAAFGSGLFESDAVKASSSTTIGEVRLIEAVPFTLEQPMTHTWRNERPLFTRGVVMVINAPLEDLERRQSANPVLQCGDETVAVLNDGSRSGYAIVVMPFDGSGTINDLAAAPLFFGPNALAEELTKPDCVTLANNALTTGEPVIGQQTLTQAQQPAIRLRDEAAVYRVAADLVERYSPDETDCIRWLRGN